MRYAALCSHSTYNLGDEIQSLAAQRLLPRVDQLIDRDRMMQASCPGPTKLIVNGWLLYQPEKFGIPENCEPLFISVHLTPEVKLDYGSGVPIGRLIAESSEFRDYLRQYQPIGARDVASHDLLQQAGIESYISGCLTLTLQPAPGVRREDAIVLVDVPVEVYTHVRGFTFRPIVTVTHYPSALPTVEARLTRASELIDLYTRAHLVITTRLHAALPCLALGTPVMLLGELDDPRFSGLRSLVMNRTVAEFCSTAGVHALEYPEPNRTDYLPYRESILDRVNRFLRGTPARSRARAEQVQTDWLVASYLSREVLGLKQAAAERDMQTQDLQQAIASAEARIADLSADVARREAECADLTRTLGERDTEIADLRQAVREADAQRADLTRTLGERDTEIAGLRQAAREADAQRADLTRTLGERDTEIAGLRQAAREADARIAGVTDALAVRDLSLNRILQSRSWRITRPLRAVAALVRRLRPRPQ